MHETQDHDAAEPEACHHMIFMTSQAQDVPGAAAGNTTT